MRNEGWIALKRNRYGLMIYEQLPNDVRVRVLREFTALVNSGFIAETADLIRGPGWPIRNELAENLAGSREKHRVGLAWRLRQLGIELQMPGVVLPEFRPWQVR
jgi:hypothetical protein